MTKQKILVVDDEPDLVELVKDVLERNNYFVISARNADIAILEHIHNPAIQMTERGSDSLGDARTEIDIRTGTYKLDDKFSEQYFKTGVLGPETVVLFPDRKKMVAFHGREALADSQRYLDGCEA